VLKALRPDEGVLAPLVKEPLPHSVLYAFADPLRGKPSLGNDFVSEKKHITPSLLVVIEYEKGLYDRSLVYHSGSWNHCLVRSKLCSDVGTVQGTVYGSMRNHCFVSVA